MSEVSIRLEPEELAKFLNSHLEMRMFLSGHAITAADIIAHAHLAEYFVGLPDYEKIQMPNTFRWIDHVQHLPGFLEEVQARGLFITFPDENAQAPSQSQLKKLAQKGGENPKAAAAAEYKAKMAAAAGAQAKPAEEAKSEASTQPQTPQTKEPKQKQ